MVAGVAGGLAVRIGVEPVLVRLAFLVLGLAAGAGLVLYGVLWALVPEGEVRPPTISQQARTEHAAAVGLITVGVLLFVQLAVPGLFPGGLVWPATVAAVGLGITWERTGEAERTRWRGLAARLPANPVDALTGRAMAVRAAVGIVLVLVGVGSFLASSRSFDALGQVAITMVVTAAGVALLLGPWILRLARQLGIERRERIRSEERAEVAAHLHDSVLQTLSLIQRTAGSPHETVSLARRQERELRAWLYGDRNPASSTLGAALDELVSEVESLHEVTVEVVTVGDAELDEPLRALVAAIREAVVNAARHSGTSEVAVYVELDPDATTAYVRDRGIGFDLGAVPDDRRGIADSIVGRLERNGGHAEVRTAPGAGTEVVLSVAGPGR
jgi:signal transduction histidine kinase/phage shock protein PspC (stress-responsive transcriptional regulator)